jgi:hypothetical protein
MSLDSADIDIDVDKIGNALANSVKFTVDDGGQSLDRYTFVPERINALLKERFPGLSHRALCSQLKIDKVTLTSVRSGGEVRIRTVTKILSALEIATDSQLSRELLGLSERPKLVPSWRELIDSMGLKALLEEILGECSPEEALRIRDILLEAIYAPRRGK